MQDNINKIKQIIVEDFEARSKKNNSPLNEMTYCFLLKDSYNYHVTWNKQEIKIVEDSKSINSLAKFVVKQKVNHFITKALLSFAVKNNIEKAKVNVIMTIDETKELSLILRNAYSELKAITVEELIGV